MAPAKDISDEDINDAKIPLQIKRRNDSYVKYESGEIFYAGILSRIGAYSLDCLILFVGIMVSQVLLSFINPLISIMRSGQQPKGYQIQFWVLATVTIPSLLYFSLMLNSKRQATLGMRLLKLKVTDLNAGRARFSRILLRSLVMLVPFELNHTVIFHLTPRDRPPSEAFWLGLVIVWIVIAIYIVAIVLTERSQSVHDLVAGTVVQSIGKQS